MSVSMLSIVKAELNKCLKRYDLITILGVVAIGFVYAIGMRGDSYTGVENQNALFWVTAEMLTSTILFICPLVMAFLGAQMLASEIDNNSIQLLNLRVRNRKKLFWGKSISLIIICTSIYVISIVILFAVYFIIPNKDTIYVSGTFTGNNVAELIIVLFLLYLYSFFFIPQIALCLGTKFKPMVTMVITFCITLVCNNVANYGLVRYLNPMQYVVKMGNDVVATTERCVVDLNTKMFCIVMQMLIVAMYCVVSGCYAARSFAKRDL